MLCHPISVPAWQALAVSLQALCADGLCGLVQQELDKAFTHAFNTVRVPDIEFHNVVTLHLTMLWPSSINSALCVVCGPLQVATLPQIPAPCAPLEAGLPEEPGDPVFLVAGASPVLLAPPLTAPAMPPMPALRALKSISQLQRPAHWLTVCAKQGMVQLLDPAWVSVRSVLRERTPLGETWTRASPADLARPAHPGQQGQASVCRSHRRAQQASLLLQVLYQQSNVPASLALEVRLSYTHVCCFRATECSKAVCKGTEALYANQSEAGLSNEHARAAQ